MAAIHTPGPKRHRLARLTHKRGSGITVSHGQYCSVELYCGACLNYYNYYTVVMIPELHIRKEGE